SPSPPGTGFARSPSYRSPVTGSRRTDMANNTTDQNATPADPNDPLRGGTQGGGAGPLTSVGGPSGGTNSISPSGSSQIDRRPEGSPAAQPERSGGTKTGSRNEPEELFEGVRKPSQAEPKQKAQSLAGSRKPSHAVAKQKARDDADVDTTHGLPAAPANPKQHDQTDPTGQSHSDGASTTEGSLTDNG